MKLLEYEAKQILRDNHVTVPAGRVVRGGEPAPALPCVLKVQVPVGGRGKAGWITIVDDAADYPDTLARLENLTVGGYTPSCVYAEDLLEVTRELYLSLMINRETSRIELVAHPHGGIEVESHDPKSFYHHEITASTVEAVGQTAADHLDIPHLAFLLTDMIEHLYRCFVASDAVLLEINPLVVTSDDKLVAADCKMELDDMASFRHPEWQFEATPADANFVTLDPDGTVATIANGAGLAMATVDAVAHAGLVPANFLDIGGGATTEKVVASFRQIMALGSVDAIVINIFGGIVQCDTVARAIIEARASLEGLPELYIRLSGTNADIAAELLAEHDITLYPTLTDCLEALSS
jgi:succinyl-CoA synthetase beta subunit